MKDATKYVMRKQHIWGFVRSNVEPKSEAAEAAIRGRPNSGQPSLSLWNHRKYIVLNSEFTSFTLLVKDSKYLND